MDGLSNQFCVSRLRRYRAPALVMLLLHLAGCTTMRPLEAPYIVTLPESAAQEARVTTTTGDRLTIREPRIEDDVILGALLDERNRRTEIRWSWPLSQVQEIEVSESNDALTLLALSGGLVMGFLVIGLAALAAECGSGECG